MGLVRRPSFVLILNDRLQNMSLTMLPSCLPLSFISPRFCFFVLLAMDVYSHNVSMIWLQLVPILYTWISIHLTVFLHKLYWQYLLVYVIVLIAILQTQKLVNWNWTFKIVQLIALWLMTTLYLLLVFLVWTIPWLFSWIVFVLSLLVWYSSCLLLVFRQDFVLCIF